MKRVIASRDDMNRQISVAELVRYIRKQLKTIPEGSMVTGVNMNLDGDKLKITLEMDPQWYKKDYVNVLTLGVDIGDDSGSYLIAYDMNEVWRIIESDLYYIAEQAVR